MKTPQQIEELKKQLSQEVADVCIFKQTEIPFSGKYLDHHEEGVYHCAVCEAPLFKSEAKFESGTGWPAFNEVENSDAVKLEEDLSHGMIRTELLCKQCDAHLGHLFEGNFTKTGRYYCVNSRALEFKAR